MELDFYVISQVVNGLIFGLLYALIALGLSVIFSIMRVVNFAHGEFLMLGGYALFALTVSIGLPAIAALPLAMVAVAVFAIVVERALLRPLRTERMERPEEYAIILTFGVGLFLQNAALTGIGPFELTPESFISGTANVIGDLYLSRDRLFAAFTAVVLVVATLLIIYKTWWGKALLATAQSQLGATVVGIDTISTTRLAMIIAGALAGAAGALIAPLFLVYPDVGLVPVVKAFVIIVLGGLGSIPGAVVGALLLGLVEALGSVYLAVAYRDVYAFLLLIVILLFRPQGLFGHRERRA